MLPKEHLPSKYYLERWIMGLCDKADEACLVAHQGTAKVAADIPVVYQRVKKAVEADLQGAGLQTKRMEVC
jgi:hypothetical protein